METSFRGIMDEAKMIGVRNRAWAAYALASALVVAAGGIALLLEPWWILRAPTPLFTAAVLIAACLWPRRVAIVSALLAAVVRHFIFFSAGQQTLLEELSATTLFLTVGYGLATLVAKIKDQREWLKVSLESVGDAIITTDRAGSVTFLNPVAEALTGWSNAEATGKAVTKVFNTVNEFTRQASPNPVATALKERRTVELANHSVLLSRNGNEHAVEDSAAPIRDRDGNMLGVIMVFRDVSARRRAEKAATEYRQWLQITLASIGDAVLATDKNGCVTYLNPVAEILTEWRLVDARGLPFSSVCELVNETTGQPAENPITRVLAEGRIVGLANNTTLISRYKKVVPIEDSAAPIKDEDGKLVGAVMVFHDVTTARRVALELRRKEQEYRTLFELSAAGNAELDLHSGRFLRVNQKFCDITGYTRAELLRLTFFDVTHPEDREHDSVLRDRALRGETSEWSAEKRYVRKDGKVIWAHVARSIFELEGRAVHGLVVVHDITERKQQELMLERLVAARTQKLQQSVRSMEEMCYSLAHDLRGPLRAIAGFTSTLLEECASGTEPGGNLGARISGSVQRMDRIISDILKYGALAHRAVEPEAVSLDEQLTAVLEGLSPELKAREPEIRVRHPLGEVMAHKTILCQVLENLVSNAIKFVPESNRPRVEIYTERHGPFVRLWVADNGVGIQPEYRDRIFDLFQRLHPLQFPGTGVGLALVRKGMERVEGRVGLESEVGKGSRFWVEFKSPVSV